MHQKYKARVQPKGGSKMSFQVKTDVGLDDGALEGALEGVDYFKVVRRKRDVRGYM